MAPKTPQANSKLPKPPSAGGHASLTGIPAPGSVLQRRSFMPSPNGASVSKTLKDMSPEQQALLAEAITFHSPGLIDPVRKTTPTTSPAVAPANTTRTSIGSSLSGSGAHPGGADYSTTSHITGFGFTTHHSQRPNSPASSSDRASPTAQPSSTTQRLPSSQISRLGSSTRLSMQSEANNSNIHHGSQSTSNTSRPVSYSGMPPLSISHPNLSTISSTPSPTTPVGITRPGSGSPAGSRSTLQASRLSAGPGITPPAFSQAAAGTRTSMMKSLPHRPPGASTAASTGVTPGNNPVATIPESSAIVPPSLDDYEIGDRVIVESMGLSGYLRFLGPTSFKSGTWAGIELDTPTGKNDGSVEGVVYFHCRPKCGIFVLAAKIAKSELIFPPSLDTTTPIHPVSGQEEEASLPPTSSVNHAAQAVSKISAGSRASKYIGMTASQLKQRNDVPQPNASRLSYSGPTQAQIQTQAQAQASGPSFGASSPTIRALSGMAGSPTSSRTISQSAANARANSPSPVPKLRSSSPTARVAAAGSRLSQPSGKPTLAALNAKSTTTHSRSPSSASSVTSQSSTNGAKARASPTPRTVSTSRGLSSRSGTPDPGVFLSPSESRSSLLDQATAIQTIDSPADDVSLQLQQLQLDFKTAMAENNQLKSEMNEAKLRLETTKLLEKKDLSYEERVFLSKTLGREGIEEHLAKELEDLHAMKSTWDKEKTAKDQELKVVTDKMTQAWLEAARSQKERTALIQEKTELMEKIKQMEENGTDGTTTENVSINQEQQILIESLQKSLQEADEKAATLEAKLADIMTRSAEEEQRLNQANEENMAASAAKYLELEHERDSLQAKVLELERASQTVLEETKSKLITVQDEADATRAQLIETQSKQEKEAEVHRQAEAEAEIKLKSIQVELQESQESLIKSEKLTRALEEKIKAHEASIMKRDQDIADLKLELQNIGDMIQSEEVDRMRKVWELEKKRLEETVADNITLLTSLRDDIQTLETKEEEYLTKIKALEANETALKALKAIAESETEKLQQRLKDAENAFVQERSTLEAKVAESAAMLEIRLSETKEKMEELEAIALTVEEWRERCEAMQLEMIQKAAMIEDLSLKLADSQADRETLRKQIEDFKKEYESKASADRISAMESSRAEISALEEEREQLLNKVSELEAALALSASAPRVASSSVPDSEVVLNRAELEEEIAALKQMVHELTAENAAVASDNKKLMQEHDILMEAHKHVETECLKLMDEVERLHSESLAMTSIGEAEGIDKTGLDLMQQTQVNLPLIGQEELKAALSNAAILSKDTTTTPSEKQSVQNQSASVIRLENLLKDKQAMLDRLTQAHALEMRDMRQRYVELDRTKSYEISQLNKELTDLESLVESKIFHQADLEEEVENKQKQIDRLQKEVADLKSQLAKLTNGTHGSAPILPTNGLTSSYSAHSGLNGATKSSFSNDKARTAAESTDKILFCEICEVEGHDLISCTAVFGGGKPKAPSTLFSNADLEDDRPYCDNCEEYGQHYTDECPNESLTY